MQTSTSMIKAVFIFFLVALFLAYEMGMQVSPTVMAEYLRRDLQLSAADLGVMTGFYFLSYTLMQIPAGLLYDRFKVRTVVIIPLLICALGAYAFGLASTMFLAALGRILMGLGAAYAFIAVLVVANDIFPSRYFAMLAGIAQLLAAIGALTGVAPLLPIVKAYGWRDTMKIIAIVGFVLAFFIWLFVRYEKERVDVSGKQESMRRSLLNISRNRQSWMIALYACCSWAPMATFASLWGANYFEITCSLSDDVSAQLVSMMWLGIAIGAPILGWWSDHIHNRRIPLMLSAFVGFISFLILMTVPLPVWALGLLMIFSGAACAGQVVTFAVVREINHAKNHAAAIGFNNMAVVIAGLIFQPLVGEIIEWHSTDKVVNAVKHYSATDYSFGITIVPLVFFLALVISTFCIRETYCQAIKTEVKSTDSTNG